jgi:NTE family protein
VTAPARIAFALQGGGAHGALSWGILDRLLEEPSVEFLGASGTSAGAMNAVLLADGIVRGGPAEARRQLRRFWERVGGMPGFGSLVGPMTGEMAGRLRLEFTPAYALWDAISRNLSPYDLNPWRYNPLRAPLEEMIDFERLRHQSDFQVMVCATNVRTARRRVFANSELSVDAVLASACLPQLFPAVEIDGEAYWDGGYTGNPAMAPLIQCMPACDLMIVRVDPVNRADTPRSAHDIQDRLREIGFNSTFWLELSAVALILKLVDEGFLPRERFGRFRFHAIGASAEMEKLAASSKLNNHQAFLEHLFALGRGAADGWLATNGGALGKRSTVDLQKLLADTPFAAFEHGLFAPSETSSSKSTV